MSDTSLRDIFHGQESATRTARHLHRDSTFACLCCQWRRRSRKPRRSYGRKIQISEMRDQSRPPCRHADGTRMHLLLKNILRHLVLVADEVSPARSIVRGGTADATNQLCFAVYQRSLRNIRPRFLMVNLTHQDLVVACLLSLNPPSLFLLCFRSVLFYTARAVASLRICKSFLEWRQRHLMSPR